MCGNFTKKQNGIIKILWAGKTINMYETRVYTTLT